MNYQVETKAIEPVTVAAMCYNGPVTVAAKHFPAVFKAIKGRSNGAPFFCYHKVNEKTGIGEMELCVPTVEPPSGYGVTLKVLPRARAICLTHIGPYETLPEAYTAMHSHIEKNGLTIQPPWREVFIKGPEMIFKGNPHKYITEILFPLKAGQDNAGY